MKIKQTLIVFMATIPFVQCLTTTNSAQAESVQLESVSSFEAAIKTKKPTVQELLEREEGKNFVINFLKANHAEQYSKTTDKYKKIFKNADSLKEFFDKEAYFKIDFIKISFSDHKPRAMTIKANVYWTMEGYDGITTIYFFLKKTKDKWLLNWIMS